MRTFGDRAFLVDAGCVGAISVAICLGAQQLLTMTVVVGAMVAARFWLFARLPKSERPLGLGAEAAFFALCAVLGGYNDWSSVVRHEVYHYRVPSLFPAVSTIPLWMLAYWGFILRFMVTLGWWARCRPPLAPPDIVRLGPVVVRSAAARVTFLLLLVVATRQTIYRWFDHPVWSWLPFALALVAYVAVAAPTRWQWRLMAIVCVVGPAVEVLYIQVGGLHEYRLGWLGGVPLWIALWWVLAVPIWVELAGRLISSALARGVTNASITEAAGDGARRRSSPSGRRSAAHRPYTDTAAAAAFRPSLV